MIQELNKKRKNYLIDNIKSSLSQTLQLFKKDETGNKIISFINNLEIEKKKIGQERVHLNEKSIFEKSPSETDNEKNKKLKSFLNEASRLFHKYTYEVFSDKAIISPNLSNIDLQKLELVIEDLIKNVEKKDREMEEINMMINYNLSNGVSSFLLKSWELRRYLVFNCAFHPIEIHFFSKLFWKINLEIKIKDKEFKEKFPFENAPDTPGEILAKQIISNRLRLSLYKIFSEPLFGDFHLLSDKKEGQKKKYDIDEKLKSIVDKAIEEKKNLVFFSLNNGNNHMFESFHFQENSEYKENEYLGFEMVMLDKFDNSNKISRNVFAGGGCFIMFDCEKMQNLNLKYIKKNSDFHFLCVELKRGKSENKLFEELGKETKPNKILNDKPVFLLDIIRNSINKTQIEIQRQEYSNILMEFLENDVKQFKKIQKKFDIFCSEIISMVEKFDDDVIGCKIQQNLNENDLNQKEFAFFEDNCYLEIPYVFSNRETKMYLSKLSDESRKYAFSTKQKPEMPIEKLINNLITDRVTIKLNCIFKKVLVDNILMMRNFYKDKGLYENVISFLEDAKNIGKNVVFIPLFDESRSRLFGNGLLENEKGIDFNILKDKAGNKIEKRVECHFGSVMIMKPIHKKHFDILHVNNKLPNFLSTTFVFSDNNVQKQKRSDQIQNVDHISDNLKETTRTSEVKKSGFHSNKCFYENNVYDESMHDIHQNIKEQEKKKKKLIKIYLMQEEARLKLLDPKELEKIIFNIF